MSDGNLTGEDAETPFFKALLTPHRSLGRGGFIVLLAIAAAVSMAHGVVFIAAGAWPIAGFFGLDFVLLFGAFALNYRAARAREEISISRTRLDIRKFTPSGRVTEHRYNPFWARLNVARHTEIGITGIHVSGEGRSTEVGSFLNPDDKESFASAFAGALSTARR